MRNLLIEPLWEARDLGKPIADSPHAVSVCLPLWEHVVRYEENDPAIVKAMWCGYPRFVMHPQLKQLHDRLLVDYGQSGGCCLSFCDLSAARRCLDFLKGEGRVVDVDQGSLAACFFPEQHFELACQYRRHTGEIVSSRQADAFLKNQLVKRAEEAELSIRQRLADWNGQEVADVFLYGNGMAAHYHLHRAIQTGLGGGNSIQFGFPYVDILKVQQKFPPGVDFIWDNGPAGFQQLKQRLEQGHVMAVYAELPNNPLLSMPDCIQLKELCQKYQVPLLVDDTVGSYANVDSFRIADVTYSSLTKYFNGACDAMGGTVIVNGNSPFRDRIHAALRDAGGDGLYGEDAVVLEANSQDYPERMAQMNQTTESLADFLQQHPKVARVHYPKLQDNACYEAIRKEGGGYGGLLSIELLNPETNAPAFYDKLRLNKGPTLGTNFSLACPYTLLAHYDELEWAESCGVSRWLIRISIGLEPESEIISRFTEALDGLPS
ncbi:MAG: PLP-dependent transferase [Verrucomicrobiota bacterium]